jgi:hypothetical protein
MTPNLRLVRRSMSHRGVWTAPSAESSLPLAPLRADRELAKWSPGLAADGCNRQAIARLPVRGAAF